MKHSVKLLGEVGTFISYYDERHIAPEHLYFSAPLTQTHSAEAMGAGVGTCNSP